MKLVIGSDHAGVDLKKNVIEDLKNNGHSVLNVGTDTTDPVDYPDYAEKVGHAVLTGESDRGILICGSGVGASVLRPTRCKAFARGCVTTFIRRTRAWSTTT